VFLSAEEQDLNAMLKNTAQAAHAHFVDTYTPTRGHNACTPPQTRWIEPLVPTSPAAV
jgi:hypothetical protein